jgi:glycosyltransferase involved in cell wall biosynthesis
MNVLVLTRYEDLGASSRYRMLQFLPYLQEHGFQVDVHSLLSNKYLTALYNGKRQSIESIVMAYLKRFAEVLQASRYDLVWIEKEAMPFLPGSIERILLGRKTRYVLDYDDAVFHRYDTHNNLIIRRTLGRKYAMIMRGASLVVAGNPYIADRAREFGARHVEVLPTVVDLDKYTLTDRNETNDPIFGWIGTPITAPYLNIIRPHFEAVTGDPKRRFAAIGSGPLDWKTANLSITHWTQESEVSSIRQLSVGVMPLVDSAFERGKCGLKLLQYMALGLPVIASPVGVNMDIVENGVNGFLCETPEEWERAFRTLEGNQQLRATMGLAGRRKVEEGYSLNLAAPRLAQLLEQAIRPAGKAS